MNERTIQAALLAYARQCGCFARKIEAPGHRGMPDVLIVAPGGKVLFLELKTFTGPISYNQESTLAKLRRVGADARITRGLEDAKAAVDSILC